MPVRYLIAAFPAALLLLAACGGSSDEKDTADSGATAGPTLTEAQARQTATAKGLEQPTVADQPLPTPTKVPDDAVVNQAAGVGAPYAPTLAEFKTLPTTEIKADGKSYTGVTLATLAEKSKAATGVSATIEGVRPDGKRQGVVRFPLADVAASTVLVLAPDGQLSVASTSIPIEQWLIRVTSVAFR